MNDFIEKKEGLTSIQELKKNRRDGLDEKIQRHRQSSNEKQERVLRKIRDRKREK